MKQCKNCLNTVKLDEIKNYQHQSNSLDPIEVINVLKCPICGCIHWEDDTNMYYEYESTCTSGNTDSAIGKWATNQNMANK